MRIYSKIFIVNMLTVITLTLMGYGMVIWL